MYLPVHHILFTYDTLLINHLCHNLVLKKKIFPTSQLSDATIIINDVNIVIFMLFFIKFRHTSIQCITTFWCTGNYIFFYKVLS